MFCFLSFLLHPPLLLLLLYINQIDGGYEKGIDSINKKNGVKRDIYTSQCDVSFKYLTNKI